MTTPTIPATIPAPTTPAEWLAVVIDLERRMPDPLDVPRDERIYRAYVLRQRALATAHAALLDVPVDLLKRQGQLAALRDERTATAAEIARRVAEIAAFVDPLTLHDLRLRDQEVDRQWQAQRGLQRLRDGSLFRRPGEVWATIEDLDQRTADTQQRVTGLTAALDAAIAQAAALLAEGTS